MSNYDKLKDILKEIFEIDKADLDFGIYRILNQKRDQVNEFINTRLPKDIKDILAHTQSKDGVTLQVELDKMGRGLDEAGVARESAPKYLALKQQMEASIDTNALEQEVFSHLAAFFKRYYKEGDFISMRRYKKDVYAIPYEGEEVKLYWANQDQYYIKTSEYLKNYSFKLKDGKVVHFRLKEASTEQNNNKIQGDAERRFAIYAEQTLDVENGELCINFTYEPHKKTIKQDELTQQGVEAIQRQLPAEFAELFDKDPTPSNKARTKLDKYLSDYISRNSFDYFIHKDLGGFLSRELDFYIKNEVLFIDDINTENPAYFTAQLSKIKALKKVACEIIDFLAQIEDFQKKLWLKKKFVVSTGYCITLDRVPQEFYPEIAANDAQLADWADLFGVKINTEADLTNEPFLVLDTKHFSEDFTDRLLAHEDFTDLDEQTNGLLINSENFQALNLLQEKYKERVDGVYIDPPYNTSASEIIYKNSYKHSSWLSLMSDRLALGKRYLNRRNGFLCCTIDDVEQTVMSQLIEAEFGEVAGTVSIRIKPSGRPIPNGFALSHEYAIFSRIDPSVPIRRLKHSDDQKARYRENDNNGAFFWEMFRKAGSNSNRDNRPTMFYPFFVETKKNTVRLPKAVYNLKRGEFELLEVPNNSEAIVFPIKDDGSEGCWYFGYERASTVSDEFKAIMHDDGNFRIYYRRRPNEGVQPTSHWSDAKYSATEHGTALLKDIFGTQEVFSYPKSIHAVTDCLGVMGAHEFNDSVYIDYFAGSGTTGHATIKLNREDEGKRKYMLVEMGTYFNTVTKPRIQKVIYTDNWKGGQSQDKKGISQLFKYQVLESYEDVLNNLQLQAKTATLQFTQAAQHEYLLKYMLDLESRDHLFDINIFRDPFNYRLNITQNNELQPTKIDLVETFNYLIGLYVSRIQRVKDIKLVEGRTREGKKTLVIWRNLDTITNAETQTVFRKLYDGIRSAEFDQIFINGDHHFDNLRQGQDQFKVKLIEETFFKKMFNN